MHTSCICLCVWEHIRAHMRFMCALSGDAVLIACSNVLTFSPFPSLYSPDTLCVAASASLQALARKSRDISNDKHCISILKLSLDALVCDNLPVAQNEGIKLLKNMFSFNAKHRETILDEVSAEKSLAGVAITSVRYLPRKRLAAWLIRHIAQRCKPTKRAPLLVRCKHYWD